MLASEAAERARVLVRGFFSVPLRALVLQLVALHGEMHGYEISKRIEQLTMGLWRPGTSTLYMVLEGLVRDGLLERREEYRGRLRRVRYRATGKGLEVLRLSTGTVLRILYQLVELLEELDRRLRRARPGERLLGPEDLRRLVDVLRRVRDLADERARQLEAALGRRRGP